MPYKDPAKAREAKRRYRERNREAIRAKGREYQHQRREDPAYREAACEYERRKREADPEAARERDRRKYWDDPERGRATQAAYRERHPERAKQTKRTAYYRYQEKYLDRARVEGAAKRAAAFGCEGSFTIEEWRALREAYDRRCAYCGERCELGSVGLGKQLHTLATDHLIPLSRGGRNVISNVVPACMSCNSQKGVRTAEEFAGPDIARRRVEVGA